MTTKQVRYSQPTQAPSYLIARPVSVDELRELARQERDRRRKVYAELYRHHFEQQAGNPSG